jgi:hypothetical protein
MNKYSYIPVFWSGTHLNKGDKKEWTVEDVNKIFTNTTAKPGRIPFTIDHPKNDLPVIGYTDNLNMRLVMDGQRATIEVQPTDFAEQILEQVKASGRKKVSIALSPDDYSIRHIGLVEKPAVKDLPAIPFEKSEETINFELECEEELFSEPDTPEPDNNFNNITEEPNMDNNPNIEPNPELLKFEQENTELKAELERLREEQSAIKAENRQLEFKQYLTDNHRGRVTPALQPKILRIMTALDGQPEFEFTEDEQQIKASPLDEFKALLTTLPEQVKFGEFAADGSQDDGEILDTVIQEFNKTRK